MKSTSDGMTINHKLVLIAASQGKLINFSPSFIKFELWLGTTISILIFDINRISHVDLEKPKVRIFTTTHLAFGVIGFISLAIVKVDAHDFGSGNRDSGVEV